MKVFYSTRIVGVWLSVFAMSFEGVMTILSGSIFMSG